MATRKSTSGSTRKSAPRSTSKSAPKPSAKSASKSASKKPAARSAAPRPRSGAPSSRTKVSRGAPTRASGAGDAGAKSAAAADKAAATLAMAKRAAQVCLDNKANEVVLLSLRGVTDMTDYFVIASGTSDTHVRALGDHVLEELKKDGSAATSVEGLQTGRWVLLDYVDFVVHLFHPTLRGFYQLERLWSDAEVVPLPEAGATA